VLRLDDDQRAYVLELVAVVVTVNVVEARTVRRTGSALG
jgi:hypothetical protein